MNNFYGVQQRWTIFLLTRNQVSGLRIYYKISNDVDLYNFHLYTLVCCRFIIYLLLYKPADKMLLHTTSNQEFQRFLSPKLVPDFSHKSFSFFLSVLGFSVKTSTNIANKDNFLGAFC